MKSSTESKKTSWLTTLFREMIQRLIWTVRVDFRTEMDLQRINQPYCITIGMFYRVTNSMTDTSHKYHTPKNYYGFLGPRIVNTADRVWLIRKQALEEIFVRPAFVDRILLKLSPVGVYDAATQACAGTDLKGIQDFFDTVRQYRQEVVAYLYDKKAFGSRQWFAGDKGKVDWGHAATVFLSKE